MQIDTALTEAELRDGAPRSPRRCANCVERVGNLNNRILSATRNIIRYKTRVLDALLACELFSSNYPC